MLSVEEARNLREKTTLTCFALDNSGILNLLPCGFVGTDEPPASAGLQLVNRTDPGHRR